MRPSARLGGKHVSVEGCGGGVPPGRAARAPAAKLPPRPPSRWPPASPEPRNWGTESPSSRKTVAQLQGARAIRRLGRLHQRSQSWGAPQLRGGATVGVRSPGRGWESGGNRPPRSQIPRTAGREARAPGGGGRGHVAVWAPRADSASHLGRGAAVQEFGVSWESRGGGEDGSGRRSRRPGRQTHARLQTSAEEWAGARPSPPELSAQGTRPGAAGEEGESRPCVWEELPLASALGRHSAACPPSRGPLWPRHRGRQGVISNLDVKPQPVVSAVTGEARGHT